MKKVFILGGLVLIFVFSNYATACLIVNGGFETGDATGCRQMSDMEVISIVAHGL